MEVLIDNDFVKILIPDKHTDSGLMFVKNKTTGQLTRVDAHSKGTDVSSTSSLAKLITLPSGTPGISFVSKK